jgi:hypothetical protein
MGLGVVLAGVTILIVTPLPDSQALDVLVALLVATAGIYVGFGFAAGQVAGAIWETVGALVFVWVALLGRWYSPRLLAAGWFAHLAWDALHRPRAIPTAVPAWVLPLCAGVDWVLAGYILARF